jgi:hypothetical protein
LGTLAIILPSDVEKRKYISDACVKLVGRMLDVRRLCEYNRIVKVLMITPELFLELKGAPAGVYQRIHGLAFWGYSVPDDGDGWQGIARLCVYLKWKK